jgi:Ca2+-transporting ATPase
MTNPATAWHTASQVEVLQQVDSCLEGLSIVAATQRLTTHGPNELQQAPQISWWKIFLRQFKSVIIWILLVACAPESPDGMSAIS